MSRPPLRGIQVALRRLRLSDGPALDLVLRDRQAIRYLPARVRRESGPRFVARVLREDRRGGGPAFSILLTGSPDPIGQIRFINWSTSKGEAEVGYWIRRKYWGRGFGREALWLACRFGFRSMRLHRIEAIVVVGNGASRRILENVGFKLEGLSRQCTRLAGHWVGEWRLGLLRGELRDPPSR